MEDLRARLFENLQKARKNIDFADHMTYITFPIIRENKLIIKILIEIHKTLAILISSILQYEHAYKRIQIYTNPESNFETFIKLSNKYKLEEKEINNIKEIFMLRKKHEKSEFEFTKDNKFIIMVNSSTFQISIEKIKEYLETTKSLIKKAEIIIQ